MSKTLLPAFQVASLLVDPPLLLAPMAGHSNVGFRTLVREMGNCGLVCSELISSHVLQANPQSRKTRDLFDWSLKEWPFAVQLFGANPEEMALAAQIVVEAGAPMVDINMGCWVPKVAKKGCGAALLSDLDRAEKVVRAVCQAVEVPVSVKVRIGFKEGEKTALPFALAAREAGAKLVTVHGRYAKQGFKGESDHSVTAQIKEAVGKSMIVIANGDIVDSATARQVLEQTGCDGLMLGRECLRRPWVLAEIARDLCGRSSGPEHYNPVKIAKRHLELARELVKKPENVLLKELRGQLLPYRLGAPSSCRREERSDLEKLLRQDLLAAQSFVELESFFQRAEKLTEALYSMENG